MKKFEKVEKQTQTVKIGIVAKARGILYLILKELLIRSAPKNAKM